MKKLTFSTMAAARLKANKRQYISLLLGIFLSIFLISTLVFSVWGIYQGELQKRYDKVGYLDFVILDNSIVTEEEVRSIDEFDTFGHAYISGIVTDRNVYVGYYDDTGLSLMNLNPIEGRLPDGAGEIAMEASAMDVLEVSWSVGETVELDITPVDGTAEKRSYTLVGILPERSLHLSVADHNGLNQFPAILTSAEESPFATGRTGVHHILKLREGSSLSAQLQIFLERYLSSGLGGYYYGLSTTGEQVWIFSAGSAFYKDQEMFSLIFMASVLAGSLILSCGIGISGAMEGVLMKRREEIGVLRALGATRRQIRRMFGRENLLLALIVSPLSILISMGAVWLLSFTLPDSLKFAVNIWLILPIVLFSVIVILISGYLPLVRASKLMPMSVIRDTAMLRRSKGVKSKKEFSAAKLISTRQIRFNPTRQIGGSLLVGLMLLCSVLLTTFIINYVDYTVQDMEAFRINAGASWGYNGHIGFVSSSSMDKRSIAQVRSLNNVERINIGRAMTVTVLLDHVPTYAISESQYGMLDDEMFEESMAIDETIREVWEGQREELRKEYLSFLEEYQIEGEAYRTIITTVDLTSGNISKLSPYIESGDIDVNAINAGSEVLVIAPEVWVKPREDGVGYHFWYSEADVKNDPNGEGAYLEAWNDCYIQGQQLSLLQLYRTEYHGAVERIDASTTVGAILTNDANLCSSFAGDTWIITTEQGLENMGLLTEGLSQIDIYLDGDITLEEEKTLERQLSAIARRYEGYTVFNNLENFRERDAANRQQIFMFAAIAIVFFSVSVGMIVSSVTRQLNSEGRTIGMLRAVGADEKAILGCYSGQINASIGGGMFISIGLLCIYLLLYLIEGVINHGYVMSWVEWGIFALMCVVNCVMGLLCFLVCKFLLRFRIREIVNKSIIDNIREL